MYEEWMNECRQNSPIHQSFTVTLRVSLLPVKMEEQRYFEGDNWCTGHWRDWKCCYWRLWWLYTFMPSSWQTWITNMQRWFSPPTQRAPLTPPAYMLEVPHESPDQDQELQNVVVWQQRKRPLMQHNTSVSAEIYQKWRRYTSGWCLSLFL